MKRLVALAIVAGFVAVWLVRPVHAPILLYLSKAETSLPGPGSGPGKITGKALLVLEGKFQKAEFFAAFAAGSEGRFYWVGGRHTAAEARHDAMAMCPGCR